MASAEIVSSHRTMSMGSSQQQGRPMMWAVYLGLVMCGCVAAFVSMQQDAKAVFYPMRTTLLGDDLRLPSGLDDAQSPMAMDDDPLSDMMIYGGADIAPPPAPPALSVSKPPGGVFSGHSHGLPGGPLTMGSKTFFGERSPLGNVFDPHPDSFLCIPGTEGPGGEQCRECPENQYCSGGDWVRDCPRNTYSIAGSYKKSHCKCSPGFYGLVGNSKKAPGCIKCPKNFHCPGGKEALPCPANSESDEGAKVCKCVAGYFNNELGECQECPAGFWCPGGGLMNACPENSNSTAGSIRVSDCFCVASTFQPWPQDDVEQGEGPHCVKCYAGAYCPGGQASVPCTSNSMSIMGAQAADECVCKEGYFGTGSGLCQSCEAGFYCPGGLHPVACPEHSLSKAGATTMGECECVPGFVGSGAVCSLCPAGSYCAGGDKALHCPEGSTSSVGASKCACASGRRGSDPFMCKVCLADEYCPGGGQETACPPNSHSRKGAQSARECVCAKGFTGTGGTDCQACPTDTYCPKLGGEVRQCPANSVSGDGSTSAAQCTCKAGYHNRRGYKNALAGPDCELCPAGSYCPKGKKVTCPTKMTSQIGSDSLDDCRCVPGHYRDGDVCKVCPAGHFCAGDAHKEPCPGVSTSDEGAVSDAQCKCVPGQYGNPKGQDGCMPCNAGFFCPGGSEKTACPAGSMSEAGMSECRCSEGYYGGNWRNCNDCPSNSFCPGGRQAFGCPANARAPAKSKSIAACLCKRGYMPVTSENTDMQCQVCPKGSFCPGDSIMQQCPAGRTSNAGAWMLSQCGCVQGYYDGGKVPTSNFAWALDGKVRIENEGVYRFCIESSDGSRLSINGAISVNNDGIHKVLKRCADVQLTSGLAQVKVEGFHAVGSVKMSLKMRGPDTDNKDVFPESAWFADSADSGPGVVDDKAAASGLAVIGSSSVSGAGGWRVRLYASDHLLVHIPQMSTLQLLGDTRVPRIDFQAARDFDNLVEGTCEICRKGHFCPGAFPTSSRDPKAREISCPGSRFSSKPGAESVTDCDACRPGYLGTDWRQCNRCPKDSYCPGGDLAMRCPAGSVTRGRGKHNIRHCVCDRGYERRTTSTTSWDCEPCRKGHYCPWVGKDARVCPGNADSPVGSTSVSACVCDPGQYDVGHTCRTCDAGYFCIGDGKRSFCGPNAGSPEGSTVVAQCVADDAELFGDKYQSSLPTCKRVRCQNIWLGTLMRRCKNSKRCRGVTMETGKLYGWGCMTWGLQSCLDDLVPSDDAIPKTFYAKRRDLQVKDSVALMRKMDLTVPECPKIGQPSVFHQNCAPHSRFRRWAWKGVLYQGSWSKIRRAHCDDDVQLCSNSACSLPRRQISSLDIPAGLEVHLYSEEDFQGDEVVLYGALDADDKCLDEVPRGNSKHWNNAVMSVKVLPSKGPPPPPSPPPSPPPPLVVPPEQGTVPPATSPPLVVPPGQGTDTTTQQEGPHASACSSGAEGAGLCQCLVSGPPPAKLIEITQRTEKTAKTDIGNRKTHFLDRQTVDCSGDPIAAFRLQTVDESSRIRYKFKCAKGLDFSAPQERMTSAEDDGNGKLVFLDRLNVDCHEGRALTSFRLKRVGSDKIMYKYSCAAPLNNAGLKCRDAKTSFESDGGGGRKIEFLDRQHPSCGNDEVMQQFKLVRNARRNKIGYEYRCCKVPKEGVALSEEEVIAMGDIERRSKVISELSKRRLCTMAECLAMSDSQLATLCGVSVSSLQTALQPPIVVQAPIIVRPPE